MLVYYYCVGNRRAVFISFHGFFHIHFPTYTFSKPGAQYVNNCAENGYIAYPTKPFSHQVSLHRLGCKGKQVQIISLNENKIELK